MENNHKRRSGFSLIKIVLLMLRHKSSKKSNSLNVDVVASKGLWRRFAGAMRPLHHHPYHLQSSSPPPPIATTPTTTTVVDSCNLEVPPPPLSPAGSDSSSTFSIGIVSQYASAQNLQELDDNGEDDYDDGDGDEMIDARAEEFITNFYEQMRLQRLESFD